MSLESLKRSRSTQLGIVTKERNKYTDMKDQDPSSFKLPKLKESIRKVEAKHEELDRLQALILEYGEDIDDEEEARSTAQDEERVESTIDMLQNLVALNKIHIGIHRLHGDLDSFSKALEEQPEKNHSTTSSRHCASYEKLIELIDEASLGPTHSYCSEMTGLQDKLTLLTATKPEFSRASARSPDDHYSTASEPRRDVVKRPTINLPTFHGDIMHWNSFWTAFAGAIDSDPHFSKINKLTYLRGCIKDPSINPILFNGVDNELQYDDVVAELR